MDQAEILKKREMPSSIEAEKAVIGSMLIDRDVIVSVMDILEKSDFYFKQYGLLFEAITELYNEKKPVDLVTVQNRLREKNAPAEITALEYVKELVDLVTTTTMAPNYARIVKEKSQLRELIRRSEKIADECYSGESTAENLFAKTESDIFKFLSERGGESDFVPISQVVYNAMDRIEKASQTTGNVTGIPTGFTKLDADLSGLQPSDLILLAARPSMGKTAFALNIAEYVAFKQNIPCVVFSLEMSKEQLVNRLFALESKVEAQKLRNGDLNDMEWKALLESASMIGRSNLILDDTPGMNISKMRSKCYKYKREHDIQLVIIDYLQLMSGSGSKSSEGSRQAEVSEISRSLKAIAREINVPIIALSQLSRAVETRPDHRPIMSDLRESGAIEQDADVVMFIYRDDYYNKDSEDKGFSEIIIAKQRNGPLDTVKLAWLPQYTRFMNT